MKLFDKNSRIRQVKALAMRYGHGLVISVKEPTTAEIDGCKMQISKRVGRPAVRWSNELREAACAASGCEDRVMWCSIRDANVKQWTIRHTSNRQIMMMSFCHSMEMVVFHCPMTTGGKLPLFQF